MFRYHLLVAFRNIRRNKLNTAINVIGLSLGFCAALLISLYIRDELSYDKWIPDYQNIYRISATLFDGERGSVGPSDLGLWLKLDYPQIETVSRVMNDRALITNDEVEFFHNVSWADSNFFETFEFTVTAGDISTALEKPNSIVLTESVAKRIFDKSNPVGEKLQLNRSHSMQVTAVIKDMPTNTHFTNVNIIAPNHASFSIAAEQDRNPVQRYFGAKLWGTHTYIRLPAGIPLEPIIDDLPAMLDRHLPLSEGKKNSEIYRLDVIPIKDIHLSSPDPEQDAVNLRGIYTAASIAFLIILAAVVNFINLMTARGIKRAPEVAIRKTAGASRANIIKQFMTESFIYVSFGGIAAVFLSYYLIEYFSSFLFRKIVFNPFTDLHIIMYVVAALIVTGLLACIYPSLVLSSYSPVGLFKAAGIDSGIGKVRQVLSIIQFTILTGLIISAYAIYSQAQFGIKEALGKMKDPVAIINTGYNGPLKQELLQIPGVKAVSSSMGLPQWGIGPGSGASLKSNPQKRNSGVNYMSVDTGFFELYDLKLAAGRFFSEERASDLVPEDNLWNRPEAIVINETTARNLGFETPQDAVGELLVWTHLFRQPTLFTPPHDARIIGVVEDFQTGSVRHNIVPAIFYVHRSQFSHMSIRIDKQSMDETLEAIDDVWARHIKAGPIQRYFFDDVVRSMYLGITRQAQLLGIYSCVTIFISILGLIGLAHFVAEKSTKEIGIRKIMGGNRTNIVKLLLWKFLKPVLFSNILALPIAYYYLSDWLTAFERQIQLQWWMFVGAGALTLIIALGTVFLHAYIKSGINPVLALRDE